MAIVKLESTDIVNSPHLVATLSIAYKNNEDDEERRDEILNMLASGYSTDENREYFLRVFEQLLLGNIPYKVQDGNTVVFDTRDQVIRGFASSHNYRNN